MKKLKPLQTFAVIVSLLFLLIVSLSLIPRWRFMPLKLRQASLHTLHKLVQFAVPRSATLAWDPSPGNVSGYKIRYWAEPDPAHPRTYAQASPNVITADAGNQTSFTVVPLDADAYSFAAFAYRSSDGIESPPSNQAQWVAPTATPSPSPTATAPLPPSPTPIPTPLPTPKPSVTPTATPVTPTPSPTPAAPISLTGTALSRHDIRLNWTDRSSIETGFKIERSLNGTTFAQIATVPANTGVYQVTGLTRNTAYWFRVRAFNAYSNSLYSNTVRVVTLRRQ